MTLPVSGAISINAINVELGVAGTTTASLGQASFRTLAGVPSGAISMSNFYGKSNRKTLSYVFSANTANASLNVSAISGYIAGISDITVTVNSGIYLYATSTGNAGLTLTGGTTGDTVTLVNNGYIMGQGGAGGGFRTDANGSIVEEYPAQVGGVAISTTIPLTINNQSGYIGGGGGGGGAGQFDPIDSGLGGGGAGGGNSGTLNLDGSPFFGAGGAVGQNGNLSSDQAWYKTVGAGGGRIMPGTGGVGATIFTGTDENGTNSYTTDPGVGGAGGAGGAGQFKGIVGGGGGGGGYGASGGFGVYKAGTTVNATYYSGSGGSAGGVGGNTTVTPVTTIRYGAAGGKAINTNGQAITWVGGSASSSRAYGAVS